MLTVSSKRVRRERKTTTVSFIAGLTEEPETRTTSAALVITQNKVIKKIQRWTIERVEAINIVTTNNRGQGKIKKKILQIK